MITIGEISEYKRDRIAYMGNAAHVSANETELTDGDATKWHYDCVWLAVREQTEEAVFEAAKAKCLADISSYDTSDSINVFYLNGKPEWMDFEMRNKIYEGNERLRLVGRSETTLWLGEDCFTMSIDTAQLLISQIEAYAKDCYNVTAAHKQEVQSLSTLEEIIAYDITKDYPQPIHLNISTTDSSDTTTDTTSSTTDDSTASDTEDTQKLAAT